MLLGVQICKNGRKFLHPNIKCPHFGCCYIIQSSKNWRQPLSRAVFLMCIFPFGSRSKVPVFFSMSGLWLLNENLFHSLLLVVCEPRPQGHIVQILLKSQKYHRSSGALLLRVSVAFFLATRKSTISNNCH